MDRLTVPYGYAPGYYRRTGVSMKEVFNRLAAYEDTGLTPGDVKDLQALCKENGLAKYVDLIVEAKRSMGISNEHSIEQDERIEQLEAENARLRAERDKAVEDLKHVTTMYGECYGCKRYDHAARKCTDAVSAKTCDTHGNNMYDWRGMEGKA